MSRRTHDTKTECYCERPLLIDEVFIGMGVNCLKCGRSAERCLSPADRRRVREEMRSRRQERITS